MVDHGHHISIGKFAGLTGISANTLRRYDESGLLSPAFADRSPATVSTLSSSSTWAS